ncbi:MAG: UDP-N-acetylmuramoyl-tripeptide--D-alanyl-D-alanine ligase [Burkholderiales bacterium]|nr:UDP-N-acetylmuramoyl-tripeptide--D-alanyl-D-alanine ligase [Burkholderiales bacterium]
MMTLSEAAAMLGVAAPPRDAPVARICTDSRALAPGDLFVALSGERFDGHAFAAAALAAGAAGVVVSRDLGLGAQIVVADTRRALGDLARAWRARFSLPLIAVTGSNGKTTVTQMLRAILVAHAGDAAFATAGNLNNDIGLPLTLLGLRAAHRIGAVELGMNHPGEIGYLADIAAPTVALVNNAQREHQEFMKTVADVAAENGAVIARLPADGVAVINADDAYAGYWRGLAGQRRVVDFGLVRSADVTARYDLALYGSHVELMTPDGNAEVALRIAGRHNVANACAAAACAHAAGVPLAAVAAGLAAFVPYAGRMQKKVARNGAVVIDDSYNANPDSVKAAIDVLAAIGGDTVLVLGRMGEVGERGADFHREVGGYARERGVGRLIAFGEETAPAVQAFAGRAEHLADIEAVKRAALSCARPGTTLLVKGSRSARMERVVAELTGESAGGAH